MGTSKKVNSLAFLIDDYMSWYYDKKENIGRYVSTGPYSKNLGKGFLLFIESRLGPEIKRLLPLFKIGETTTRSNSSMMFLRLQLRMDFPLEVMLREYEVFTKDKQAVEVLSKELE